MADQRIEWQELDDFVRGPGVWAKWDAARRLMAAKQMQAAANTENFRSSFRDLGEIALRHTGVDQLLAIALIVRIAELVKGELRKESVEVLTVALRKPIDGIWTINEVGKLPLESKPSEIRENIALALTHATGGWVLPYIIEALGREEKSFRCRLELTQQLASREASVSRWFEMLGNFTWLDVETADRIGRLKELAVALATTLREHRNTVSVNEEAGSALARMMQEIAPAAHRGTRSGKFVDAALAIVNLLNELLATEFTLIADPEAYAPLAVFARWWQPSSYPAVVAEGLQEIVRKLVSAIRLRARLGQKSENLVLRLRQALGNTDATAFALNRIAETETGLAAGIDDWLRGRERESSATAEAVTSLLSRASTPMLVEAIAPLLLDSLDASVAAAQHSNSPLAGHLRRICGRIQALAAELKLQPVGIVGQVVEFNPAA